MLRAALLALALLSGAAAAEEMASSLRPLPNPAYLLVAPAAMPDPAAASGDGSVASEVALLPGEEGLASSLRPMPRPKGLEALVDDARKGKDQGLDLAGLQEVEPEPVPKGRKKEKVSKKGSVCGVASIKGEAIAAIKSKVKGCGLDEGVRVTSVSGVRLSQAITVDCATAKALNAWVTDVVQPAYGGAVVELKIAAHYICRTRNNKSGAKISEHGRGKAVDIAGFVLDNGKVAAVLGGYNKKMRRVHKGACGLFSTTLGPGSDGYHEDHLHFDTASHRSGTYCR
jgi:hypothetical protein